MMLIRRADTDQTAAIPRSLAAVHVSLAGFRRFLLLSTVALVVTPLALLAMFANTPLQFLPLIVSLAGILWLRMRSLALERELRRARVRALDAIDVERERIQRDIHDGAQQRLVSVRIHLGLLSQDADWSGDRTTIDQLGRDLEAALADLRNVTRDGSPQLLLQNGVVDSLRSVAAHAPLRVSVESVHFGRYAPKLERGVYYSCLEALQNVVKHGGPRAVVRIRLVGEPHRIRFSVDDSGVGFDPAHVETGQGLINLADRVDVMGGHLTIDSLPGMGTRIHGEIPVTASLIR
jgi:signal transduction histidine kinase